MLLAEGMLSSLLLIFFFRLPMLLLHFCILPLSSMNKTNTSILVHQQWLAAQPQKKQETQTRTSWLQECKAPNHLVKSLMVENQVSKLKKGRIWRVVVVVVVCTVRLIHNAFGVSFFCFLLVFCSEHSPNQTKLNLSELNWTKSSPFILYRILVFLLLDSHFDDFHQLVVSIVWSILDVGNDCMWLNHVVARKSRIALYLLM